MDELEYLKLHYPYENDIEIANVLNKTSLQIRCKANRLKLCKSRKYKVEILGFWSDDEIEYLKNNVGKEDINIISKKVNRTIEQVRFKIKDIGLNTNEDYIKSLRCKPWSDSEVKYLIQNFKDMRVNDISTVLNRTIYSIHVKAYKLNLSKDLTYKNNVTALRNKQMGRDLNYDNLKEIAKQYNTKQEFYKQDFSAYRTAQLNGWLDDICSHMITLNYSEPQLILYEILKRIFNTEILYDTRQVIKPYELDVYIPKYKLAFEYDGKLWHINNPKDAIKDKMCIEQHITLIRIKENNRKYFLDIITQLKEYLPEILKKCDINIDFNSLNEKDITRGIYDNIMDMNKIKAIILNYTDITTFKKENLNLYNRLHKRGLLETLTKDLDRIYKCWTMDAVHTEIDKYITYSDFLNNSPGCYQYIKKNKLEHLIAHLIRKYKVWTIEKVREEISKYNNYKEFRQKSSSAYRYIIKNNLEYLVAQLKDN